MEYNIDDDQLFWLKGSFVARTHVLEDALIIQQILHKEGLFSINAAPMGGNRVLLTVKVP